MFLGKHQSFMEDGHSLLIPAAYRGLLSQGFYITQGFEQNLLLLTEKAFQEKCERLASLNIADPTVRLLLRLMLANASRLEVNAAGRVSLPDELAAFAGMEKEVVLVGQGDYIEAWSPEAWEKQSHKLMEFDANATRFAQLDLALA